MRDFASLDKTLYSLNLRHFSKSVAKIGKERNAPKRNQRIFAKNIFIKHLPYAGCPDANRNSYICVSYKDLYKKDDTRLSPSSKTKLTMNYSLCSLIILLIFSCKPKQQISYIQLSNANRIVLLDSIAASEVIIIDEKEKFFSKITPLEMSIQMKVTEPLTDRLKILADYKVFLQNDVEDFSEEEQEYVEDVLREAYDLCNQVDTDIFPPQIRLIKTKGQHYGNSVYYTREDVIVIPENELQDRNRSGFLQVMLHEIFHIYSRYNDKKRYEMYELIGFEPLDVRPILPQVLQNRIIINPDGIDINYKMKLKTENGDSIEVMPIIVSARDAYSAEFPAFFDYVKFDLYELKYNQNNSYTVLTDEEGFSTLDLRELPDFFDQIEDNTQYIIHPDEILADNFAIVILAAKKGGKFEGYSEEGTVLLEELKEILQR